MIRVCVLAILINLTLAQAQTPPQFRTEGARRLWLWLIAEPPRYRGVFSSPGYVVRLFGNDAIREFLANDEVQQRIRRFRERQDLYIRDGARMAESSSARLQTGLTSISPAQEMLSTIDQFQTAQRQASTARIPRAEAERLATQEMQRTYGPTLSLSGNPTQRRQYHRLVDQFMDRPVAGRSTRGAATDLAARRELVRGLRQRYDSWFREGFRALMYHQTVLNPRLRIIGVSGGRGMNMENFENAVGTNYSISVDSSLVIHITDRAGNQYFIDHNGGLPISTLERLAGIESLRMFGPLASEARLRFRAFLANATTIANQIGELEQSLAGGRSTGPSSAFDAELSSARALFSEIARNPVSEDFLRDAVRPVRGPGAPSTSELTMLTYLREEGQRTLGVDRWAFRDNQAADDGLPRVQDPRDSADSRSHAVGGETPARSSLRERVGALAGSARETLGIPRKGEVMRVDSDPNSPAVIHGEDAALDQTPEFTLRGPTVDTRQSDTFFTIGYAGTRPGDLAVLPPARQRSERAGVLFYVNTAPADSQSGSVPRSVRSTNGLLPVPTRDRSRLVSVVLSTSSGAQLREGADYDLVFSRLSDAYFIRLREPHAGRTSQRYRFEAGFADGNGPERGRIERPAELPAVSRMNLDRLSALVSELRTAGFEPLADALDERIASARSRGVSLSIEEVGRVFRAQGRYTYVRMPATPPPGAARSRFAAHAAFIDDEGRHCIQCTGARSLFVEFLNTYFENQPQWGARGRAGYLIGREEGSALRVAHRHTQSEVTLLGRPVLTVDTTPSQVAPGGSAARTAEHPEKEARTTPQSETAPAVSEGTAPVANPETVRAYLRDLYQARARLTAIGVQVGASDLGRLPIVRQTMTAARVLEQFTAGEITLDQARSQLREVFPEREATESRLALRHNYHDVATLLQFLHARAEEAQGVISAHRNRRGPTAPRSRAVQAELAPGVLEHMNDVWEQVRDSSRQLQLSDVEAFWSDPQPFRPEGATVWGGGTGSPQCRPPTAGTHQRVGQRVLRWRPH